MKIEYCSMFYSHQAGFAKSTAHVEADFEVVLENAVSDFFPSVARVLVLKEFPE